MIYFKSLAFLLPGEGTALQSRTVPPPAPLSSIGFLYGLYKLDSENLWLKQTAMKFSANIIGCWSICLRETRATGRRGRRPLRGCGKFFKEIRQKLSIQQISLDILHLIIVE